MEENTNMTEQTQAENMGNESEVQGQEAAKTFTQDEVNRIIQERLERAKKQATKDQESEYAQKAAELQAREMKLLVKEQLSERGMPRELADIITCTDEKDLNNKLEALQKIYGDKAKEEKPKGFICVGARPYEGNTRGGLPSFSDPVRNAMGLN